MKNPMLLRTLTVSALLLSISGFSGCSVAPKIESIAHQGVDTYFPIQSKYFHPAGRLKSRGFYKPILLKDGRILIASDNLPISPLTSGTSMPEIYDPKTQTTVTRSDLLGQDFTKKYKFISAVPGITLQDGRVLFVYDESIGKNLKAKEGEPGYTTQKQFPTAYLLDPKTGKGKFYYDQSLAHSASQLTMKPNGHVLGFSGLTKPYTKNAGGVFDFNPKDETFKKVGHFRDELMGIPDTPFWLNKEQIILIGRLSLNDSRVELYNTNTNTSETLTRFPLGYRSKFIAILPDNTLLESAMITPSATKKSSVAPRTITKFRVFSPKTKQFTDINGTLHTYLYTIQLSDGNVLLIADEQIALFDAKSKTIKIIDQFNRKIFGESLIVTPADKVYLLGGTYSGENGQPEIEGHIQDVLMFDYKKYLQEHS